MARSKDVSWTFFDLCERKKCTSVQYNSIYIKGSINEKIGKLAKGQYIQGISGQSFPKLTFKWKLNVAQ